MYYRSGATATAAAANTKAAATTAVSRSVFEEAYQPGGRLRQIKGLTSV